MNPILDLLRKSSPQMNNISNTINMLKTASNPSLMLQQLSANNPQVQQAMQVVQKFGGDPQKAFYETAKQMGVDPNEILRQLKS